MRGAGISATCTVTVEDSVDISRTSVDAIPDQMLRVGYLSVPSIHVRYDGVELVEGIDYTKTFANNRAVGKAQVTIVGKGGFVGTRTVSFNITPMNIASTGALG